MATEIAIPAQAHDPLVMAAAIKEALPYIARFVGKTVVVKIGGSIHGDGTALEDIVTLARLGVKPVVVHGGGPMISEWQGRMGLEPKFVDGRRYTDEMTLDLARMVLIGKANSDLVAHLVSLGGRAVGLSGIDGGLIKARLRDPKLGLVGEVTDVDLGPVKALMDAGYLVVVAPSATDDDGPAAQRQRRLDRRRHGPRARGREAGDVHRRRRRQGRERQGALGADRRAGERLIASGEISGGMIPKVEACVRALDTVPRAHILDGRVPHALLGELFTDAGVGTMITRESVA